MVEVTDLGSSQPATFMRVDMAKYGATVGDSARQPRSPENHQLTTQVWLYGNWWLLDRSESLSEENRFSLQLIGIGVSSANCQYLTTARYTTEM